MAGTSPDTLDVTLSMETGNDHRRITLTADQPVELGRVSRSEIKNLQATSTNGLFDCPVVSRSHAELKYHRLAQPNKQISIKDLNSKHGTAVNGDRLPPRVEHHLSPGDHIKIGGPIVVGTESHDGITFVVNVANLQTNRNNTESSTPNLRGFHAPSCDSDVDNDEDDDDDNEEDDDENDEEDGINDNDDEEDHLSSCSEYDNRHDANDDYYNSEEDEDTSAQTTPEQIKTSKPQNDNRSIELGELCTMDHGGESTFMSSVFVPGTLNPSISTAVRTVDNGVNVADTRSSSLWPVNLVRDYPMDSEPFKPTPAFMTNSHDDTYEECPSDEDFDEDDDSCDAGSDNCYNEEPITTEKSMQSQTNFNMAQLPTPIPSYQQIESMKPRYDPVRSSPGAAAAHASDLSHTFVKPIQPYLNKAMGATYMTPGQISQDFKNSPFSDQKNMPACYIPFMSAFPMVTPIATPSQVSSQGYQSLPAMGDAAVPSLPRVDQPQPSPTVNKISIPELVERTIESKNESGTDDLPPQEPEIPEPEKEEKKVVKQVKRKADEMEKEIEAVVEVIQPPAKKARVQPPKSSGRAMAKGVVLGAIGGAIGTMAFLTSPAVDVVLDWLE